MQYVHIKNGSYRNAPVTDLSFPVVKPWAQGAKGGFITVNAEGIIPERGIIRILVEPEEFVYSDTNDAPGETKVAVSVETDEQIIERIGDRFAILNEMTEATVNGDVRAMIVVGPPGVGKSYGVVATLEKTGLMDKLADRKAKYEIVKGAITPLGLYAKLHEFQDAGNVVVFDDCDTILLDDLSLNILKAALDSSKHRVIHWNADSSMLRREGIPNKFEFKGAIIFLTNLKFDNVRSPKLRDHLAALQSRCHYLDLTIDTMREKLLRIKQIAMTGELFPAYGMTSESEEEIIKFMQDNASQLREVSLRMAIKLADLRRMSETRWQTLAVNTCMKGSGKLT